MINPFNYSGFDVFIDVTPHLDIFKHPLCLFIIPLKFYHKFPDYYNSNIKSFSNFSHNSDINSNLDISKINLNKDLRKIIGGGYTSYKNVTSLGFVIDLLENRPIMLNNLLKYLSNLDINKTYTLLPVIRWIDDTGLTKSITISDSMKITKLVDSDLLADKLYISMNKALYRYEVIQNNSELILMNRHWLDINDFKENDISSISNTMDNLLSKNNSIFNKEELIMKRLSSIENDKYNNIIMDNYGETISINDLTTEYTLNSNQFLSVKKGTNNTNYITVKNFDNSDNNLIQWSDTKTDFGFIRKNESVKYYFNNYGKIFKSEGSYNFLDYPLDNIHDELDDKIGAIDFETFGNEGIGIQQVYAAGWAINDFNQTKKFYYIDKQANSLDVVKNLIYDLANDKNLNGYTFYAHNLGRFDSVFLIKACIFMDDIVIKPKWKENKILSITIYNKKNKCKFKILDSIQMLNSSLDILCKSFDIIHKKGIFPHNFINKDNLNYIGDTPDFYYFKNMPIETYNKMKSSNWNLKDECLKYLESDVLGLLEVMVKFNEKIFNLYSLNITSIPTAAKLAMAIFTSNFYKDSNDLNIKLITGNVEKDIRQAYFGGNVNVLINKMDKAFYYDMNSQYPFAMLNDMPIGNPTFSNDTVLDNYFGFVYGEITPPDYNRLRVPYIQCRDEKTDLVDCPRHSFSRMIFSEEIKDALKDGYSINIKYGYKFERGKNLFKNYVETFYEIKKSTKDPVEKTLSKLLLNSLYGKFGMRDITSTMKIMSKKEAKKITNNYNYSLFADLGEDKVLIKYSSKLPEPLRKLVTDNDDNNKDITLSSLSRKRGVPSAVQISAAISAYARMSINKFKNIPGNPCVYSDTDSVVLPYKLPDICIGKELGQMKLEHEIMEGIFIRKKLYALKNMNNQVTIKSSGVKITSLNYDKFKLLLAGNSVKTDGLSFNVIWKNLDIDIVNRSITLKGLNSKLIDINDHYDINFKSIVPYTPPIKFNRKNIEINILEKPYRFNFYIKFIRNNLLRFYYYILSYLTHWFNHIFKKDS